MSAPLVQLVREGGVARITLARPAMQNALVPELLDDFLEACARVAASDARAVLLTAQGSAFSIGGDMRRFAAAHREGRAAAYAQDLVGRLNAAMLALIDLPQPVVAAVHGLVTGGSLGFLVASDIVLLAPAVLIKAHYVSAGFAPDGGWTALLPALIGQRRTAQALFLNRTLQADEAVAWGLANEIVPGESLPAYAFATAARLAGRPAGTLLHAKRRLWDRAAIAQALEDERRRFVAVIDGEDARRGVADFLERFDQYPSGGA